MRKTKEQNKGITMIALVITIIVMLILVSVTIATVVDGGIFDYAGKAVGDMKNALATEQSLSNGRIKVGGIWYNNVDDYIKNIPSSNQEGEETDPDACQYCTDGVFAGYKCPECQTIFAEFAHSGISTDFYCNYCNGWTGLDDSGSACWACGSTNVQIANNWHGKTPCGHYFSPIDNATDEYDLRYVGPCPYCETITN